MTKLVNIKNTKEYDIYIGRQKNKSFHFGNPWSHIYGLADFCVESRDIACENFEKWILGTDFKDVLIERRQWILMHINEMNDKIIACHCVPAKCHGLTYMKMLKTQ